MERQWCGILGLDIVTSVSLDWPITTRAILSPLLYPNSAHTLHCLSALFQCNMDGKKEGERLAFDALAQCALGGRHGRGVLHKPLYWRGKTLGAFQCRAVPAYPLPTSG